MAQAEQDVGADVGLVQHAAGRFSVDGDRVVHETIDDETILIALEKGTYYSLAGSGAEMWTLLSSGIPLAAARTAVRRRYPDQSSEAVAALERLAGELVAEGLLQPIPGEARDAELPDDPHAPSPGRFESPTLHRYTDMEYFLRLDPIHEVDPMAGWPEPPVSGAIG